MQEPIWLRPAIGLQCPYGEFAPIARCYKPCRRNLADVKKRFPPGVKVPPSEPSTIPLLVADFDRFAEAKKGHLRERDYWYLNLIGRNPERQEAGV